MHPELISFPHISSYSVFWLVAFLAGYLISRRLARSVSIDGRHVDNLFLLLLITTPLGARLFSRVFYMSHENLWNVFKLWNGGGLVFYGGVLFGVVSVVIYCGLKRLPLWEVADLLAPALAIGLAFGRIGCYLAGCCWGDVCADAKAFEALPNPSARYQIQTLPWISDARFPMRVQFPKESDAFEQHRNLGLIDSSASQSLPVHPVQLYEAVFAFGLCTILLRRFYKREWSGEGVAVVGIGYAAIRFFMEFLRADNPPIYFGLTFSQMTSLLIALFCALLVTSRRVRRAPLLERDREPTLEPELTN